MPRRAPAVLAILVLLGAAASFADGSTEDRKAMKRAKRISVDDLRNPLDKDANSPPVEDPEDAVEAATEKLVAELKTLSGDMLSPMQRLETLTDGYGTLPDLAAVEVERDQLRKELLEKQSLFKERLQALNSTKKMPRPSERPQLMASQTKGYSISPRFFGEEMRNFRLKLSFVLQRDEDEYQARRLAIEEMRASERPMKRALTAGAGACLLFCGVAAWFWKRRGVPGANPSTSSSRA